MKNSRKIILGLISILGFVLLIAPIPGFAQTPGSEQLTITTYYPSPYGVYNKVRFFPITSVPSNICAGQEGLVYYDATTEPGQLMVCGQDGTTPTVIGGSAGWTIDTNKNLHNSDSTNNVIIDGGAGDLFVLNDLGIGETFPRIGRAYSLDINNSTASLAMGTNGLADAQVSGTPMVSLDCSNPISNFWNPLATFNGALKLVGNDAPKNPILGGIEIGTDELRPSARPPNGEARWILEATDSVTFKGQVAESSYSISSAASDVLHDDYSSWVEVKSNERPLSGSTYKSKGISSVNFNNGDIQVHGMPPIVITKGSFHDGDVILYDTRPASFSGVDMAPEDEGYSCYVMNGPIGSNVGYHENDGSMTDSVWKFIAPPGTPKASTVDATIFCARNELLGTVDPVNHKIIKNPKAPLVP